MRILVADNDGMARSGLRTMLESRFGWEVCAEAESGDEAIQMAHHFRPDVVILDLNIQGVAGLEACATIKATLPGVEIVILSCHYSPSLLQTILRSGALGFVLKSEADRNLVSAVDTVRRRETYISRHIDALLPASSKTTPVFMLLGSDQFLTSEERAHGRTLANQMRDVL